MTAYPLAPRAPCQPAGGTCVCGWQPEDGAVGHGGGIQTTALLIAAGQGVLKYKTFLFANVGDDSEEDGTLTYLREIAQPYAQAHGLTIHELARHRRTGEVETLFGRLTKPGSKSLPIPVRMSDEGAPGTRSCTANFKIQVVGGWLKAHGATGGKPAKGRKPAVAARPAELAMGISLDEIERANNRKVELYERMAYPLIGVLDGQPHDFGFGRPLRRIDCERMINAEPLPGGPRGELATRLRELLPLINPATREPFLAAVTRADLIRYGFERMPRPPKSACWFCPLHQVAAWRSQRRNRPATFARAAELENLLNARRDELGKDHVFLTRYGKPLAKAIPEEPDDLFADGQGEAEDGECDNGYCFS